MSHHQSSSAAPAEPSNERRWLLNAPVDLAIGCGGWTAPLLLATWLLGGVSDAQWSVLFYGLALVANYPHYMATLYRACATPDDRRAYRGVLSGATLTLILVGVVAHLWVETLPWLVTLYVVWSPWHYTGQNFGIAVLQFRRAGVELTVSERRRLWWAFTASYVLLIISFSGPQVDPFVLAFELPSSLVVASTWAGALVFGALGVSAFARLERRVGSRAVGPAALLFVTQALWFTVPTLVTASLGTPMAPTRYSAGMLALMHSAQYLWITHYHAQREAESRGSGVWRPTRYAAVLLVGGMSLFVPGPWLLSFVAGVDFSTSMLVFAAVVNIHHFVMDGVVWKLRDARVAARLVGPAIPRRSAMSHAVEAVSAASAFASRRASRVAVATTLLCLAALDQVRYVLALDRDNATALAAAAALNPHDSAVHMRLAQHAARGGDPARAIEEARAAVALQPALYAARQQFARLLIESERFDEALSELESQEHRWPDSADVWVNVGLVHRRRDRHDEAERAWRQALDIDPGQTRVHLYLAELLRDSGRRELAVGGYERYLQLVAEQGDRFSPDEAEPGFVMLRAAELHGALDHPGRAAELIARSQGLADRLSRRDLAERARQVQSSVGQSAPSTSSQPAASPPTSPPSRK